MPNKIKSSFENGKKLGNKWNDDNQLHSVINDCIIIENDIKGINKLNETIEKWFSSKKEIKFIPEESYIDEFIQIIKLFGNIISDIPMDEKIKRGFRNIVAFSLGTNIPITYTKFLFPKNEEDEKNQNNNKKKEYKKEPKKKKEKK